MDTLVLHLRRPATEPDELLYDGRYTLKDIMATPDYSMNESVLVKFGDGVYQANIVDNTESVYKVYYPDYQSYGIVPCAGFDGSILLVRRCR